jgi:lipoate-protein ligase A
MEHCNIALEQKGISDLAVGDRKVLGSSLYLPGRQLLYCYQSSLMVGSDLSLINRYLRHPPREPDYRSGRGHDAFCANLRQCGCRLTTQEIADIFNNSLPALIPQ